MTIAIPVQIGMVGIFNIKRINAQTLEVVEELEFENLITDGGLNRIGTGQGIVSCIVGTGTTPPTVSDVMMQTARANTSSASPNIPTSYTQSGPVAPYWGGIVRGFRFGEGAASGNLSEIGIAYTFSTLTNHALFSRALIKDAGGNPTTITVLANEFLDVSYECRSYLPPDDKVVTVNVMTNTHTVTIRGQQQGAGSTQGGFPNSGPLGLGCVGYHTATLGTLLTTITGSSIGNIGTCSLNAYVNLSLKRSMTLTMGLTVGNNVNGISGIVATSQNGSFQVPQYQILIVPPVVKDNTMTLSFTLEYSWSRRA